MHWMQTKQALVAMGLAATSLLPIAGCKRNATTGERSTTAYTQVNPATAGVIEGTIHLAHKAPPRVEIDMAQDPACAMGTQGTNYSEGILATDGKLQNVFIYVKDGLGNKSYAPSSTPVVLDQQGCRYVPHVIG